MNHRIYSCSWIESTVKSSVFIETSKTVAARALDGTKPAPDQDFAISVHCDGSNLTGNVPTNFRARVETGIEATISVKLRHRVANCAVNLGEAAADQHVAVRLNFKSKDGAVEYAADKTAVCVSVGEQPGNDR